MLILSFCTFVGAKVVKKEQMSKSLFHKSAIIVHKTLESAENGVSGHGLQRHDRIMRYLAYARYGRTLKGLTALVLIAIGETIIARFCMASLRCAPTGIAPQAVRL